MFFIDLRSAQHPEEKEMARESKMVYNVVLTAMMMCLVLLMTFIIRIPIPGTHGYIHLGDSMVFLAVIILGWKWGAVAAAVGSALADFVGGFAIYAPVTLAAKGVMAVIVGLFIEKALKKGFGPGKTRGFEIIGMVIGGLFMVACYYGAETVMYGNWVVPLAGVFMNCLQFIVGAALAFLIAEQLYKTPAKKVFKYRIPDAVKKEPNKKATVDAASKPLTEKAN